MAATEPSSRSQDAPIAGGVARVRRKESWPLRPTADGGAPEPPAFRREPAARRPAQRWQIWRPPKRAPSHQHGVAGAALRLLQHGAHAQGRQQADTCSAWCPTTAMTARGLSGWQARTTCSTSARPPARCSTLAKLERKRVPLPAARMTTLKSGSDMSAFILRCFAGL